MPNIRNTPVRKIPIEDFFRSPEKSDFRISPDGEYFSYLKPYNSRLNVYIKPVAGEEEIRITEALDRSIKNYYWANSRRIVYLKDNGGDENYRLYGVNIDGSEFKELTPYEDTRVGFLDELKTVEDEILITMNKRDQRVFDVYKINVYTGDVEMIAQNPGDVTDWFTDHNGKVRAAMCQDGVTTRVMFRKNEDDEFKLILEGDYKESSSPVFFTFDNKNLYITSNLKRDKYALYEFDPVTKENIKLIFEQPEVDVDRLLRSDANKSLIAAVYQMDKQYYHFFDSEIEGLFTRLQDELKGMMIDIASMTYDEKKLLLYVYSDKNPGEYYLYDKEKKDLTKLAETMPWICQDEMSEMRPISYKSRDGLTIHGYLTIPNGIEVRDFPVVINPHGGPWMRDEWKFLPVNQFLANRGYAVLNVNFRGSSGYGRKFKEAGFKEWGRKMQDDITDGAKWLIDEGIADPDKIAIYGISFGGYSTLAGVAFTPDLYACAVDVVGPTDLVSLVLSIPPYWEAIRGMLYETIGDPERDMDMLKAASPVYHTDKIKAPLFIVQGAKDPRVKKEQSDKIVEALRSRGVEVKYMCKENEGHGYKNEENIIEMHREMEEFFKKYLGVSLIKYQI